MLRITDDISCNSDSDYDVYGLIFISENLSESFLHEPHMIPIDSTSLGVRNIPFKNEW